MLDLLEAQFRSVLICPLCSHESPTFDPYFTVPLSVPQSTTRPLFVVMVYYNRKPRLLCLGLNADITATFGEVKQCLVQEAKIGIDHLILTELASTGFRRPFRDDQRIASLAADENKVYAVETPPSTVSPVGSAGPSSVPIASVVLVAVNARCSASCNSASASAAGAQKCSR